LARPFSIPVFYQQWRLSREMSFNDPGGGDGVGGNLLSMLLPYPLMQGTLPNMWGSLNLQWNGHFYYFGSVLLVAFLAAVAVLALAADPWPGARGHRRRFVAAAVGSGDAGGRGVSAGAW
jgi:hypothetical protein